MYIYAGLFDKIVCCITENPKYFAKILDNVTPFCYNKIKQKEESHTRIKDDFLPDANSLAHWGGQVVSPNSPEGGESDGPVKVPCGRH